MPRLDNVNRAPRARDDNRRDERWETLKRRVQLLGRLDGPAIELMEGLFVVRPKRVLDQAAIVRALRASGRLDRATFERTNDCERPPLAVTREVLAVAQRDLRALSAPPALAMARDRRRALARYGDVDEAWLKQKSERLDALASALARVAPRAPDEWFLGVLELVRLVHGERSAETLDEARLRLTSLGAVRRRHAEARIEALLRALDTEDPPEDMDLAPLVLRLERARELPGRARRTRVLDVLRKAVAWPEAPAEAALHLAAPSPSSRTAGREAFAAAVRDAGRAIVRALPSARDPGARDRALEMLAFYALTFRVGEDGIPLLSAEDVERAIAKKDDAAELASSRLTLAQALALVELPLNRYVRRRLATWVADGLAIELVTRACKEGHADALARTPSAQAARAYATWATRLIPHYRALGITFELSPELFSHLPRNEDAAVLAVCLMEQTKDGPAQKLSADPIAILDATLGMFQKLPAKASGILDRLKGTSPGAGRRAFPELAAWLDDDALLDRFVHLAHIAGVPAALTRQLREDFEHEDKAARERAHLAALPVRHARQEARLATLSVGQRTRAAAPRKRTKRRLAERIEELLPIAYRRELDGAFKEILREAWGISVPALTPAWRDAVRFWLVVDDNRKLLGRLLREAAATPRRDVKRAFAKNREWLARVEGRMDVAAWLAPRRAEIEVEGARYEIAVEEDPLEVLRMGIPFGTCLALDTGCNAASTVLNAIDANKRVLYVRNRDNKIVARKLVALTKELRLVGYNLYIATTGPQERAIRAAVDAMCRALGAAAGTPLAGAGEPEVIHEGFWYDDGAVSWGEDFDVASYCRALDLAAPPKWFDALATEARARAAMDGGDVDAAVEVLTRWDGGPANLALGAWLVERLGERETLRRAEENVALGPALLRMLARSGEDGMVRALATATRLDESAASRACATLLHAFPRSAKVARALADAAVRAMRVFPGSDDHGFVHMTMDELPGLLDGVAASFDALDCAEPAWRTLIENEPGCEPCRRGAGDRAIGAVLAAFERAPEPDAVTACLMSRHRGELSQRAALAIAAQHTLPGGPRALARLGALRPSLAGSPTMLAATLRQEAITAVGEALAKRLPRPERAPFEALGEALFTCEGLERVLEAWPAVGLPGNATPADAWVPGPWELAWLRRRPDARVRDALFAIAKRTPGVATRAMELLAMLGDVVRLEQLHALAPEDAMFGSIERELERAAALGPVKEPTTYKTTYICRDLAKAVSDAVEAAREGALPAAVRRGDVVDRRLVAIATRTLSEPTSEARARAIALDVITAWSDPSMRWDGLLRALAAQGDAAALRRVLDDKIARSDALEPALVARLWSVEGAREALAGALARHADDDWSLRTAACERAAAASAPPHDADGLFEAWAFALVEQGAASTAAETESLDRLRVVLRVAAARAAPVRAIALYEELLDDLSASLFLRALRRLPRDRQAALRDAAGKLRFNGDRGAARKAWLLGTRPAKKASR